MHTQCLEVEASLPRRIRDLVQSKTCRYPVCTKALADCPCQNSVVIIGDACHPTLPYQAQGAAMAVEDGAVLGALLGNVFRDFSPEVARKAIPSVLQLFELLRKKRTTLNVKGAESNRRMYHMHDGSEQAARDMELKSHDGVSRSQWNWIDPDHLDALYGFDVIADAERQYRTWREKQQVVE